MKLRFAQKILESVDKTFFAKGRPFHFIYPLFEAADTFFFTPNLKARGKCHVRDCNDFKRMMMTVIYALIPCVVMGLYNVGYQANRAMEFAGAVQASGDWHAAVLNWINGVCPILNVFGASPWNVVGNIVHGLVYFLPLYIVTMIVGIGWETLFAKVNNHEINEGFFVTGIVFPLTCPPNIPLWQVVVAISFGTVIGKEIFGGTGRNFLNPALVARAFLFFAYAGSISGERVWTTNYVDGFTGATPLALATNPDPATGGVAGLAAHGYDMLGCFIGTIPGSFGETSTLACLIGALFLIVVGVASWRVMLSMTVGGMGLATLLYFLGSDTNAAFNLGPFWHFVLGGFAFGMVFMATDPVSAANTHVGQYIYGLLIGALIIVIRVLNPAYPEGTMLAILFGNCCAPLIDWFVVQANVKRREQRLAAK